VKSYDEITRNVLQGAAAYQAKARRMRYAVSAAGVCAAAAVGSIVYLQLARPETIPPEDPSSTVTTTVAAPSAEATSSPAPTETDPVSTTADESTSTALIETDPAELGTDAPETNDTASSTAAATARIPAVTSRAVVTTAPTVVSYPVTSVTVVTVPATETADETEVPATVPATTLPAATTAATELPTTAAPVETTVPPSTTVPSVPVQGDLSEEEWELLKRMYFGGDVPFWFRYDPGDEIVFPDPVTDETS